MRQVYHTNQDWEDCYRQRWQFDKIVRYTHGVNLSLAFALDEQHHLLLQPLQPVAL
jgi:hypothetical protein